MPFPVPNLDNRTFQGIVDELKQRIPLYCPEWTDHNVSDPGVTLIELFAYVVEQMLYRMNQIPEQHYLQFAKWLGVQRRQPKAARANVGFWLSSPPKSPLLIPRETRVATTQTETQPSQEYVLEKDFIVYAPKLKKIIPAHGNQQPIIDVKEDGYFVDRPSISVFSPKRPVKDDCLYLGFDTGEVISKGNTKQAIDLSHHMLEIAVSVEFNAAGGGRREAPYSIAAFSNQKGDGDHNNEGNWIVCDFVDFTENMNKDGAISFILPGMPPAELFRQRPHQWLRIKLISDDVYSDESPLLRRVVVSSVGFTTSVVHAHEEAIDEFVGISSGLPGQRFRLQSSPVLQRLVDQKGERQGSTKQSDLSTEVLCVTSKGTTEAWTEVEDFANASAEGEVYTLDSYSGEIRFGPAIRAADGTFRHYGAVPPTGAELRFTKYRYGSAGVEGDVGKGMINTLKTSDPNIKRVENLEPATGGVSAETLEELKLRLTHQLVTPQRAVTAADFEFLGQQQFNHDHSQNLVGKIWCPNSIRMEGGASDSERAQTPSVSQSQMSSIVRVYMLPTVHDVSTLLTQMQSQQTKDLIQNLQQYLQKRCLVTTRVSVDTPKIMWLSAIVSVHTMGTVNKPAVTQQILALLNQFINPFIGGPNGDGWKWGQQVDMDLLRFHLRSSLSRNVELREIEIWEADPQTTLPRSGPPLEGEIKPTGVVASGRHEVRFLQ